MFFYFTRTKDEIWDTNEFLHAIKCLTLAEAGAATESNSNQSAGYFKVIRSHEINKKKELKNKTTIIQDTTITGADTYKPLEILSYVGFTRPAK